MVTHEIDMNLVFVKGAAHAVVALYNEFKGNCHARNIVRSIQFRHRLCTCCYMFHKGRDLTTEQIQMQ